MHSSLSGVALLLAAYRLVVFLTFDLSGSPTRGEGGAVVGGGGMSEKGGREIQADKCSDPVFIAVD